MAWLECDKCGKGWDSKHWKYCTPPGPVTFTREEFEKFYGPCPDWLWKYLTDNYKQLKDEHERKTT